MSLYGDFIRGVPEFPLDLTDQSRFSNLPLQKVGTEATCCMEYMCSMFFSLVRGRIQYSSVNI